MKRTYFDKVVWVTGASSGIGRAMTELMVAKGAKVILSARNRESLEQFRKELDRSEEHLSLPLDLGNSEEFERLTSQVIARYGRIDVLINNGGISQRGEAHETSMDVDRKIMEINYFGNIALTKAVLPYMTKQQSGQIIVISSIAGKFGFFLRSAYSASKHALHGFYESLRLEQEKNGLAITIACPGKINTSISKNALNATGDMHGEMDHNQATGMSAEQCASEIIEAASRNTYEVLVGNKEIKAVTLKRFFPSLFWKIIRKQSAT